SRLTSLPPRSTRVTFATFPSRQADRRPMTRLVRPSRRLAPLVLVAVLALAAVGCFDPSGGAPVPVMGQSALNADQMAEYFWSHQPPGSPCLTVSVEELTADFQWHGNAENVRGDIAFEIGRASCRERGESPR